MNKIGSYIEYLSDHSSVHIRGIQSLTGLPCLVTPAALWLGYPCSWERLSKWSTRCHYSEYCVGLILELYKHRESRGNLSKAAEDQLEGQRFLNRTQATLCPAASVCVCVCVCVCACVWGGGGVADYTASVCVTSRHYPTFCLSPTTRATVVLSTQGY